MKKVIVSVTNDLITDQRVDRTCLTLAKLDLEVRLVGRKKKNSYPLPDRSYQMFRFKLIFEKGFWFYASYNIRLFFFLLFQKADLLFANDLDTLLPNYLVSKIKRIPLVYDTHEYFTEVPELANRPLVKKFWKRIERYVFPKLEEFITVNDSIALLYKNEYNKRPTVVRNIAPQASIVALKSRAELGLPENKKIIILQGAGINIDRGAEEALEAMQFVEDAVLLIAGDGDVIPVLKQKSGEAQFANKVVFIPKQPFGQLYHYTANADLGLTLDKDTNINYRYSLPNKLFDYIHAGIPVLASPLIEIKKIIDEYQIGCTIENHDVRHIAEKITYMLNDSNMRSFWKQNLKVASVNLNWEAEEKKLVCFLKNYS